MPDIREQLRRRIDAKVKQRMLHTQLGLENLKRHSFENAVAGKKMGNSSVLSGSIQDPRLNGGRPTLVPFLYNGKVVSAREAGDLAVKSGRVWPSFDTNEQATLASKGVSNRLGRHE